MQSIRIFFETEVRMGVGINKAGSQRQTVGVNHFTRRRHLVANSFDLPVRYSDIPHECRLSAAIVNQRIFDK